MPDKIGAIKSSHSTGDVGFNIHKPEVKDKDPKQIDIGNILNGSKACAYMG